VFAVEHAWQKLIGASGRAKPTQKKIIGSSFVATEVYVCNPLACAAVVGPHRFRALDDSKEDVKATRTTSSHEASSPPRWALSANESWAGNTLPPLLDALVWPNAVPQPAAARRSVQSC